MKIPHVKLAILFCRALALDPFEGCPIDQCGPDATQIRDEYFVFFLRITCFSTGTDSGK